MELIYKRDALHAVLHNEGQAAVAAVENIKPINPHGELREMLVDEMIDRANRLMTNAELIKALRETDFGYVCEHCEHEDMCRNNDCVIIQAADALEAAEKRIAVLEADKKTLINVVKDKSDFHATKDAMRIAELEKRLSKEGEWIEVHDWLHIPQEERGTYRCSACGQVMKYPWSYCPNCGAKMKGEK